MKNRMTVLMLAAALMAPTAALWATAGDASTQGPGSTVTGTSAPKVSKKHHGHHVKKTKTTAPATPSAK